MISKYIQHNFHLWFLQIFTNFYRLRRLFNFVHAFKASFFNKEKKYNISIKYEQKKDGCKQASYKRVMYIQDRTYPQNQ